MAVFYPGARPLNDDLYFSDRAQIFVSPYGEDYEENIGDFEQLSMAWDIQEKTIVGNDSTIQIDRRREVYKFGGQLSAGLRQKTEFTKDILFASDPDAAAFEQAIVAAGNKTIALAKKGRLYPLGSLRVTDVVVTDGAEEDPVTYVHGVDYFLDADTGRVQALKDLATMAVAYKAPALTIPKRAIGSKPNKFYGVRIRQINVQGDDIVFPKCLIRADGNFDFASDGSGFGNVAVSIAIQMDPASPPGFEFGWAIPISDAIPAII